ncbi:MAG: hypothetical protein ACLPOO_08730 [Terriglobales bacterium]
MTAIVNSDVAFGLHGSGRAFAAITVWAGAKVFVDDSSLPEALIESFTSLDKRLAQRYELEITPLRQLQLPFSFGLVCQYFAARHRKTRVFLFEHVVGAFATFDLRQLFTGAGTFVITQPHR